MLTGGCFCGHVRYEVDATPSKETHCHCTTCRRTSAAPFVTWFTVPAVALHIRMGAPAQFSSSAEGERSFCPRCGTALTFRSQQYPGEIDITTCSLDDPEAVRPRDHTYVRSQLSWVKLDDDLPRFATTRS